MSTCDEYQELLSGLLDDELTAEEARTANQHLSRCTACRSEYEKLRQEASRLDKLSFREPQDEALAGFWRMPYSGLARTAGLVMVVGGYLLLLLYGFVNFLADDEEGFMGKLGFSGIIIGGTIILSIVLTERIIASKTDPYKEIER